jgi:hypothetical protein
MAVRKFSTRLAFSEGLKMDDRTTPAFAEPIRGDGRHCTEQFSLPELRHGKNDKLGNRVEEILWVGRNYLVYRSQKGVYVQFSDDPEEEAVQRNRFTEICPELCELRYLTSQMSSGWNLGLSSGAHRHRSSLYDHNIAQAVMLVMEDKIGQGKQIAQQALKMAVQRVTNDNTIRYVRSCIVYWVVCVAIGFASFQFLSADLWPYVVAGMSGATGAVLSIATRLQAFELKPCYQSNMNYWMSAVRVGTGVIAGAILYLWAPTILSDAMSKFVPYINDPEFHWETAATLGLLGGFAERFIPNFLLRTIEKMETSAGTPVQAVRSKEMHEIQIRRQNGPIVE